MTTMEWLEKLMHDGVPVYYIDSHRVLASSIQSITVTDKATYITLHDGAIINAANFGRAAYWSRSEAEKARAMYDH